MKTEEKTNGVKINFERIEIFTNVAKTECTVQDVRRDFADLIYNGCNGIEAHALAMKIYQSSCNTEYNGRECQLIKDYANRLCTPAFIDAIQKILE